MKLAKKYHHHYTTIRKILINVGITPKTIECKTTKHAESIIKLYKQGIDTAELGRRYHIASNNILKFLRMNNIPRRKREEYCKKYPIDLESFRDPSSELTSYWLGFLFADGNLRRHPLGAYNMKVKLAARDISHLYQLAKDLHTTKIPTRQHGLSPKGKPVESATLIITNKEFYMLLQSYGWFEFKKGKLRLPENLNLRHFVRGLFDGDGIVTTADHKKYLRVGFCSPHKKIITFVKKLCDEWIQELPSLRKVQRKIQKSGNHIYEIYWVGKSAVKLGRFLYCDSIRHLRRKTDRIMFYINNSSSSQTNIPI